MHGLLKIMSKMGISVLSSYRGGCNFETVGLSRTIACRLLSRSCVKDLWNWVNWYRKKDLEKFIKKLLIAVETVLTHRRNI